MSDLARFLAEGKQGVSVDEEDACARLLAAIEAELLASEGKEPEPLVITDEERAGWDPDTRRLLESIEADIDGEAAARKRRDSRAGTGQPLCGPGGEQ